MNIQLKKAYIYQPEPAGANDGKIYRVVFKNNTMTPLLSKPDAEYVLSQQNKLSVAGEVRKALNN
jgi:hypothetical protein